MMKTDPPQKNPDLVYDVGMHKGEDTDFYLKKGFRVIAFEADPQLAEECRVRFKEKIQQGRLVIVEGAIVDCKAGDAEEKTVKFYRNRELSVWGTVDSVWASRNEAFGTSNEMIEIPSIDFSSCLKRYGVPYYMKIDIEGMDLVCLKALKDFREKPDYISIESEKISFAKLRREIRLFNQLGYSNFKAVNQSVVQDQKEPADTREGCYLGYTFQDGSSGLFGTDLAGKWKSSNLIIAEYMKIFLGYSLFGDTGILRNTYLGNILLGMINRISSSPVPGWYDTHARHDSAGDGKA